jgi:hypothetical protein
VSFSDDLSADLGNVFFADFQQRASINGAEVVGYLDVNNHQFLDLDTNQRVFSAPYTSFPTLSRGDNVIIGGVTYAYVTSRRAGQILSVIIEL